MFWLLLGAAALLGSEQKVDNLKVLQNKLISIKRELPAMEHKIFRRYFEKNIDMNLNEYVKILFNTTSNLNKLASKKRCTKWEFNEIKEKFYDYSEQTQAILKLKADSDLHSIFLTSIKENIMKINNVFKDIEEDINKRRNTIIIVIVSSVIFIISIIISMILLLN